ncbi:apoptosis facilitator Bcl-2-like protein 14 isoform X2 [Balearica regulorum gibbericeps]|uniref:apoptosis facilitator Bcl-2-like protein 14 isoform X2 n=1 Tax=Balearica regulorum gibbericeps TaxID=100784 RepID=UPI003F61889E
MSSPSDVCMEEILLEDDERDSIEYRILMAYAQRRLSVSRYGKLLKNEANVQKSSSLIRRRAEIQLQGGWVELQGRKEANPKYHPGYRLPVLCGRAEQENPQTLSLHQGHTAYFLKLEAQSPSLQEENSQHQTSETADVNHIADKLVKLVASRSQEPLSDQSFRITCQNRTLCEKQDDSDPTVGSEGEEHDEEKIIQTIVSLLRQSGDQLEEKIKKDRVFYQCFKDMLSYPFFKRITDVFLEDVSADSTREPGGHTQCTKVAFTMEVATRLTAVDNHPMNLVLGFGLKYLREHFKPWIQDQGGWEKALTSLDQEEVE